MLCPSCGKENAETYSFCLFCGQLLPHAGTILGILADLPANPAPVRLKAWVSSEHERATHGPARHKPRKGKHYMFCPSCGEKYAEGTPSCRFCYRLLPSDSDDDADGLATAICLSCGKRTEADCFCRFCGSLFPPDLPVDPLRRAPDFTQRNGSVCVPPWAKTQAHKYHVPSVEEARAVANAATAERKAKEAAGWKFRTYRIAMLEYKVVCAACKDADGRDWPEDRPLGEICERGVAGCECELVEESVRPGGTFKLGKQP